MGASATGNEATASVRLADLLAYNNSEVVKWKAWFEKNPAALDVRVGEKIGTVRELVKHIFQAENFLAARIFGEEVDRTRFEPKNDEEMWALHERGYARLAGFAASATEEDMARVVKLPFGGGREVSTRKVLTQAALHNVHHWAQIAMVVRQAGMPSEGPHDIILSDVMA
jgi:uncharacterized damage-inducible protein DinB